MTESILFDIRNRLKKISEQREVLVVCDWDEVVQNFELYLFRIVVEEGFEKPVLSPETKKMILRGQYPRDLKSLFPEHIETLKELFYSDELYNQIPLTRIPFFLKELVEEGIVSQVVFLTHIPRNFRYDLRKKTIFEKLFKNDERFHFLATRWIKPNTYPQKKGHLMRMLFPNFTLFIDDHPDFILGALDYFAGEEKIYLSPIGTHPERDHLKKMFQLHNLSSNYYEIFLDNFKCVEEVLYEN